MNILRDSYYNDPRAGSYRNPQTEFEPSLTDQSYNFNTQKLVENFFATGRNLASISKPHYIFPDGKDDGTKLTVFDQLYGADKSDVYQAVQRQNSKISDSLKRFKDAERSSDKDAKSLNDSKLQNSANKPENNATSSEVAQKSN